MTSPSRSGRCCARASFNKAKKYGFVRQHSSHSPTRAEQDIVNFNCPGDLAHRFFQRIYPWWRAHGLLIDEG
eukprot:scaffold71614_cov33-Tisochrysis_lutea.AAC.1